MYLQKIGMTIDECFNSLLFYVHVVKRTVTVTILKKENSMRLTRYVYKKKNPIRGVYIIFIIRMTKYLFSLSDNVYAQSNILLVFTDS